MATTAILNTGDAISVDLSTLLAIDVSKFMLVDTVSEPGKREAVYQKTAGVEEFPMTLRVGHYTNSEALGKVGQANVSIKITTFTQKVDTDGDVIYTLPTTATLAWSCPGLSGVPDVTDLTELIGNLFSVALPVVSGALTNTMLNELKFGVVNNVLGHANSHS